MTLSKSRTRLSQRIARSLLAFAMALVLCVAFVAAAFLWLEAEGRYEFFFNPNHANAIRSRRLGDEIVAALRDYQTKEGHFPSTLEDLQPLFVNQIPRPIYGSRNWSYRTVSEPNSRTEFVLSFHAEGRYPIVYFESRLNRWSVDN